MKKIIVSLAAVLLMMSNSHGESSCKATSIEKKLSGAAKNSFMKKCEKDAQVMCASDEISQRTRGAAKKAHIIRCVKDAVGY